MSPQGIYWTYNRFPVWPTERDLRIANMNADYPIIRVVASGPRRGARWSPWCFGRLASLASLATRPGLGMTRTCGQLARTYYGSRSLRRSACFRAAVAAESLGFLRKIGHLAANSAARRVHMPHMRTGMRSRKALCARAAD